MREFPCVGCNELCWVSEDKVHESYVCRVCNTRQVVPADAKFIADPAPEANKEGAGESFESGTTIPRYTVVQSVGWVLIAAGFLMMVAVGVICPVVLSHELSRDGMLAELTAAAGFVFNGLILLGLGQLLHCIRDMAINSWKSLPKD